MSNHGTPGERRKAYNIGVLQGLAFVLAVLVVLYLASYLVFS